MQGSEPHRWSGKRAYHRRFVWLCVLTGLSAVLVILRSLHQQLSLRDYLRLAHNSDTSALCIRDWRLLSQRQHPCNDLADLLSKWQNDGTALLLQKGASHWKALNIAKQPKAGTNSTYTGIVTTSPSPTFLVLTNNTKARRAREQNQTAPAYLDWMTYHEFNALSKHKSRKLHFTQEFYYFQGIPHDELDLIHAFDTLPSLCWSAAHWGRSLHTYNLTSPTLRATSVGSVHALHYDKGVDTLLVVLQGRKAVTLVPQEQTEYLYPYPLGHIFARRAQVDLDKPDYEKFPLSQLVKPERFVMHPGDILFFSAGTPHHTVSQTDVVSLTYRLVH